MTIIEVTRHAVAQQRIEQALEGMPERAFSRWHTMRYGDMPLRRGLRELGEELAEHVAARTLRDPGLRAPESRTALITVAECAMGVLSLACFPEGDFSVSLPLVSRTLDSEELHYEERWEPAQPGTSARTWIDGFAWSVLSGLLWEPDRMIDPLLRDDYAPAIRDGVPYSKRQSVSPAADLAEMNALCGYLTDVQRRHPDARPGPAPLPKPNAVERTRAAGQLDTAGTLTPDQRLLRVLLDDDQPLFEQELRRRLMTYREGTSADPAVRSLLPVGAVTLTALAQLAHGWQLDIRSAYLPEALVSAPQP
ncbi:Imm49 family immunity protein [Micromonospora lupini]|uniref:Imm49 family immunity protein n=1 Tax=Micromonospora lupini TaxID=285679 RepID=UPI0033F45995